MRLLTFHKILIATTLAFFLFFGVREISRSEGSTVLGIAALAVAAAIASYFMWVIRGGYDRKANS